MFNISTCKGQQVSNGELWNETGVQKEALPSLFNKESRSMRMRLECTRYQ